MRWQPIIRISEKVGSPQASRISNRKVEGAMPSLYWNGERMSAEPEKTSTKLCYGGLDKGGCELSLGITEADKRYYDENESYLMGREGAGNSRIPTEGEEMPCKQAGN
nr:uncharacterized protein LOC107411403 [Ziziphus jujuba var. spinosa]